MNQPAVEGGCIFPNIAGWNDIPMFNRKYMRLQSGAPIFQPPLSFLLPFRVSFNQPNQPTYQPTCSTSSLAHENSNPLPDASQFSYSEVPGLSSLKWWGFGWKKFPPLNCELFMGKKTGPKKKKLGKNKGRLLGPYFLGGGGVA